MHASSHGCVWGVGAAPKPALMGQPSPTSAVCSSAKIFFGELAGWLTRSCGFSDIRRLQRQSIGRNCRVVPTNPVGEDWRLCDSAPENRTDVFAAYDGEQGRQ